eukprot:scaffold198676_cov19-Tisochrysis_lutea.AAC.1
MLLCGKQEEGEMSCWLPCARAVVLRGMLCWPPEFRAARSWSTRCSSRTRSFFRTSQEGLTLNDAFSGFAKVAFYRSRIAPGSDLQPTLMYPPAPCSPFPMSTLMRQTHPPAPRSRALYPYTQALEAPHSHAP